ncbi:hypothetical protein [Rhodococcus sp. IEGM 1379]|uniref:putative phage holin n=1 Tax=Rhodococcus sp. IEGM 1379 TaxID=3047086 RepID=UPI0024B6FD62|nr:hypothetical protein [Rhodococcus sp. IEGM 1379]MDI9914361.1 hypothetical protein [Rhodococcus sp. IEGM 1379]
MTLAANVSLLVLACLVAAFTLIYLIRSPWRKNHVGRIYAAKSTILSVVLIQITVAVWGSPDFPFRQEIRLAIYALGALVYLPMIWSLVREQQRDRREPVDENSGAVEDEAAAT